MKGKIFIALMLVSAFVAIGCSGSSHHDGDGGGGSTTAYYFINFDSDAFGAIKELEMKRLDREADNEIALTEDGHAFATAAVPTLTRSASEVLAAVDRTETFDFARIIGEDPTTGVYKLLSAQPMSMTITPVNPTSFATKYSTVYSFVSGFMANPSTLSTYLGLNNLVTLGEEDKVYEIEFVVDDIDYTDFNAELEYSGGLDYSESYVFGDIDNVSKAGSYESLFMMLSTTPNINTLGIAEYSLEPIIITSKLGKQNAMELKLLSGERILVWYDWDNGVSTLQVHHVMEAGTYVLTAFSGATAAKVLTAYK